MKQALYVAIATVLTGILLFLLSRWPVKHTETITGRPEDKLAGQAASIVRAQNATGTSGNYRERTAKPSNLFRTSRLSIGSGAVTVLEIDHGLPEQLVDTPEMRRGVEHGLLGAITLRVVDSSGLPVPSATVRGAFFNQRQPKDKRRFEIETDADGIVSLENENMGFVNFTIEKQAHYSSVCLLRAKRWKTVMILMTILVLLLIMNVYRRAQRGRSSRRLTLPALRKPGDRICRFARKGRAELLLSRLRTTAWSQQARLTRGIRPATCDWSSPPKNLCALCAFV